MTPNKRRLGTTDVTPRIAVLATGRVGSAIAFGRFLSASREKSGALEARAVPVP